MPREISDHYRNIAADKRASSLQLRPRKPQKSYFRHFTVAKPCTDIDLVRKDRLDGFKSLTK